MNTMTFGIQIRKMEALPRILMLVHRLGGRVEYLSAAGCNVTLSLSSDSKRSHRFAPQLRKIIDVSSLMQLQHCGQRMAG
jgi:acetolactate synthase regulatory subunit